MKKIRDTFFCIVVGALVAVVIAQHCYIKAPSSPVSSQTIEIWRVTAYCPEKCCCGKWSDGYTASGAKAVGKLIAAPKDIPFHTWINVLGYGYVEVLDRGSSIRGKRLDVLFPTHQEALNWGVKYLEIKI